MIEIAGLAGIFTVRDPAKGPFVVAGIHHSLRDIAWNVKRYYNPNDEFGIPPFPLRALHYWGPQRTVVRQAPIRSEGAGAPAGPDPLLDLPFDHYQRYLLTSRIVECLWRDGRPPLRILDVGGHGSSLKHFLPDDQVIMADIIPPATHLHDTGLDFLHDGYVLGSGTHLPFRDDSFDLVTAHDTIEHLPTGARLQFLQELFRVGRRFVLINGPVDAGDGRNAAMERQVLEFGEAALSWANPYLSEHVEYGIPSSVEIEGQLRRNGVPFVSLPNGSSRFWFAMMILRHYLLALPRPQALQVAIDRSYNASISPVDFGEPCYRRAYVAANDPADADLLSGLPSKLAGNLDTWRRPVAEDLGFFAPLIEELKTHAVDVRREFSDLRDWLGQKDASIAELNSVIRLLEADLRDNNTALAASEAELRATRGDLESLRSDLESIRSSFGYRLLEAYRRRVRWLFPKESKRGAPYRAARGALDWSLSRAPWRSAPAMVRRGRSLASRSRHVIQNEGWGAFSRKARRKIGSTIRRRPVPTAAMPVTYEEWIAANEPGPEELDRQRKTALLLPYRPLISVVVPVWNPSPSLLRETIESILAQTYDNWEICLADGGSSDPEVRSVLERAASSDSRVKVRFLGENRGISGNSNEALGIAAGEFVAFLDHTDTLAPNALWEVCAALNRDPGVDCMYSDHDLISEHGVREQPLFKPRYSPEMLFSANYMAHLCVLRREVIERLGGLRSEMDGAQDWDLVLRAVGEGATFARIPKILYHWRTDSGSAVTSPWNKPYALRAQEQAIQDHLDSRGLPGEVLRDEYGGPRVRWHIDGHTRVSVVIPTKHNRKLLEACLRNIDRSQYRNWEVIIVDSGGRTAEREQWYERIARDMPVRVLWWDRAFNYSAVNNLGAREAEGNALLFLNDDTEVSVESLGEMVGWIERDEIGVVGAQLTFSNGSIQHGGDVVGLHGFANHLFTGAGPNEWTLLGSARWYRDLTATTGACLLIRSDLFRRLGGFNEHFQLCGSDVELCIRVRRAGYRVLCTPFAGVVHHERSTRGTRDVKTDAFTSFWHYQPLLNGGDPYFSPNLSVLSSVPQLRHPDEPSPIEIISPVVGRELVARKQGSNDIESEAATLVEWCQIGTGETDATRALHESNKDPFDVRSINWFIPDMVSPFYGGIHTILRFAAHFKNRYGVENRFIVMGSGPEPFVRSGITAAFPELADCDIRISSLAEDDIRSQPYADVSIATLWITAYAVSKFGNTRRKFYMIQDYEPIFYPAGTLSALSEATYRLGLYGLCNTLTLRDIYVNEHGGKGLGFVPAVDTSLFHPPEGKRHKDDTLTLFLYGRPGHWRNCFELAIAALRRLKQRARRKIRIVTAGSWVESGSSEATYLVENLGLLDYRETAALYRQCDVGLCLSVSKHPSYLPLEMMASGALVVSNFNPSGFWLLHDEENCLLAEPTAESICATLERAAADDALRDRLSRQAVADIQANHSDWPTQIDRVYRYICDPEGRRATG